jgi:hypothetical protein
MTPNSGAAFVKGDEEISGIINIAEELKTSSTITSRGNKTISIQKLWLDKLRQESRESRKEFWYLKFAFGDHEKDWYAILDSDMIMSMVYTMLQDRQVRRILEDENKALRKKIEELEDKHGN